MSISRTTQLLYFIIVLIADWANANQCTTPDNSPGTCNFLSRCEHLRNVYLNRQNDPSALSTLRKHFCGFRDSLPLVCCKIDPGSKLRPNNQNVQNQPGQFNSEPPAASVPSNQETKIKMFNKLFSGTCGKRDTTKIVYGTESKPGSWPWVVSLGFIHSSGQYLPLCGGTLITTKHVITAEHCFINPNLKIVRVGDYDLRDNNVNFPHQEFRIAKRKSANFNTVTFENDIALVFLDEYVTLNDHIQRVCLPSPKRNVEIHGGDIVEIAGWGKTENSEFSYVLKQAEIETVGLDVCKRRYDKLKPLKITDKHICAGTGYQDTCTGDSGGPMMKLSEGSEFTLVGVVSFGPSNCGSQSLPGVYTKVVSWVPWIVKNLLD